MLSSIFAQTELDRQPGLTYNQSASPAANPCGCAARTSNACSGFAKCAAAHEAPWQPMAKDYGCGLALAAPLLDYPALAQCAVQLAEQHIGRRDLAAAAAVFDGCAALCATCPDARLRAALLQRLLPMSMEVLCMQGRTEESFARWCLLCQVMAEAGRRLPDGCPICSQAFTPYRACIVLSCGHAFHRECCDAWMGRRMLATRTFCANCPDCGSPDTRLQPTPAALQALEGCRRASARVSGSSSGTTGGGSTSAGCTNSSDTSLGGYDGYSSMSDDDTDDESESEEYDSDTESGDESCCSASNSNTARSGRTVSGEAMTERSVSN